MELYGRPLFWVGVFCINSCVSRLVSEDLQLSGSFHTLTSLIELRVLSQKQNQFPGLDLNLTNLTSLKLLFLSHNWFDSRILSSFDSLLRLYRLNLSFNNFSSEILISVNHLPHLLTLCLERNRCHHLSLQASATIIGWIPSPSFIYR